MKKILIITVGGSCQPIVKSIKQNKPSEVYFICSDDSEISKGSYLTVSGIGKVCGGNPAKGVPPDTDNILQQSGIANNFKLFKISNPDSINICFEFCYQLIEKCTDEFPDAQIVIDYTGGTKSMSSALVLAASNFPKIIISLVAGQRSDLIKTKDGTEQIKLSRVNKAYIKSVIDAAQICINKFDYSAAISLLEDFLSSYPDVPDEDNLTITDIIAFAKVFESWDKFDHGQAYKLLTKKINTKYSDQMHFLRLVMIARSKIDLNFKLDEFGLKPSLPASGFEIVQDLIYNLERRAISERFDDATARMYRAIELFAQIYLKNMYGINTSDVDLEKIPEGEFKRDLFDENGENKKVQTALLKSYELIGAINATDKIYVHFRSLKVKLLKVLETRNYSILAHGFNPISKKAFDEMKINALDLFLLPLIKECSNKIDSKFSQFYFEP